MIEFQEADIKVGGTGRDRKKKGRDNLSLAVKNIFSQVLSLIHNKIHGPFNFHYPLGLNLLQPSIPSTFTLLETL